MAGIELPGTARDGLLNLACVGVRLRLAAQPAVDVEHLITTDDNAIGSNRAIQLTGHPFGLGLRQGAYHVTGRSVRSQSRGEAILVDPGDDDQRIDAGLAKHFEAAG